LSAGFAFAWQRLNVWLNHLRTAELFRFAAGRSNT
jgi:hypothetical protein